MRANLEAFRRWRIVPRVLRRDLSVRDLSLELLGTRMPAPVMLAPIGVQTLLHDDGELASARAAGTLGLPLVTSTASATAMEEIAEANGDGPRWFQLYWPNDDEIAASLVRRAEAAGYSRPGPDRRQLRSRLEAARPGAGLSALRRGDRDRPVPLGPCLPVRAREAAGGGHGRRHWALPRCLRQSQPDLGAPRVAARSDDAADRPQGHPPPRRRAGGPRAWHRRDRGLQPRRPPDRWRDRLARRAAADRRCGGRGDGGAARQRDPLGRGRLQGACARRGRSAGRPPLPVGPRARRPERGRDGAALAARGTRPDDGAERGHRPGGDRLGAAARRSRPSSANSGVAAWIETVQPVPFRISTASREHPSQPEPSSADPVCRRRQLAGQDVLDPVTGVAHLADELAVSPPDPQGGGQAAVDDRVAGDLVDRKRELVGARPGQPGGNRHRGDHPTDLAQVREVEVEHDRGLALRALDAANRAGCRSHGGPRRRRWPSHRRDQRSRDVWRARVRRSRAAALARRRGRSS